jgi:FkbM family methyltransferase
MTVFLKSLKEHGHLDNLKMTIGQVGSRKISDEDDYGSQAWEIFGKNLTIYGFDADANATEEANADIKAREVPWKEIHAPVGLSDKQSEATLYVTKAPMCSSLYEPNEAYIQRFASLLEFMSLEAAIEIETTTLDIYCKENHVKEIDFLQVDVQGAELNVLQGAINLLEQSVLAIQTEVEFAHLYKNQPLFSDIDIFLREKYFTLFTIVPTYRPRRISPIFEKNRPGQILWGDAFYMRDLITENKNQNLRTPEQMMKLACIADILGFPDYSLEVLAYLTIFYGKDSSINLINSILDGLSQFPELVEQGLENLSVIKFIRARLA